MTQNRSTRRSLLATSLALAATAALPQFAHAQAYPSKPITFVEPFAAGSATDQLARALGQSVGDQSKQPVIVDNKGGASGMIAAAQVAKAAPDGYTVLITTNTTHAANEHLYKKLSYDPVKDFAPITGLGKGGQVLVVRTDAPYKNVMDLVAAAKKTPGKLSFGSGSSSSTSSSTKFIACRRGSRWRVTRVGRRWANCAATAASVTWSTSRSHSAGCQATTLMLERLPLSPVRPWAAR